jgi:hypothetical protein
VKRPRPQDAWVVLSTFRPGDKGTRRLLRDWGERLVCVRYRYNAARNMRLKTVEIVVDEAAWKRKSDADCGVEIRSWEKELRDAIVAAGGKWNRELGLWILAKGKARSLGLERRAKRIPRQPLPAPGKASEANILGNRKANTHGNLHPNAPRSGNHP